MERIEINDGLIMLATAGQEGVYMHLMPDDLECLEDVQSHARRAEIATWRALVRMEMGGVDIYYDAVGRPVVSPGGKWNYIGVTHTGGRVAVIFSGNPCAIDMELTTRDFSRAMPRFLSQGERLLPEVDDPLFLPAVWCAKETLYKLIGRPGADFIGDMRIEAVDFSANVIFAAVSDDDGWTSYPLNIIHHPQDGLLIVYSTLHS